MNLENQDKIKKIISIILLFFWCILIFYFSNQVGIVSENSSSRVINIINKIFNINLYNYKYSSFIIRKLAHMFLYFVLYLLSLNVCNNYKFNKKYLYAFLFCFIYSVSDEVHQLFIFERSFQLTDILIDMLGSTISFCVIKIISCFNSNFRIKRGNDEGENIK